jgi:hypothetical protein
VILSYYDSKVTITPIDDPRAYLGRDKPSEGPPDWLTQQPEHVDRSASGTTPEAYRRLAASEPYEDTFGGTEASTSPDDAQSSLGTAPASFAEATEPLPESEPVSSFAPQDDQTQDDYVYQPTWTPSALDSSLNLATRDTLMMVEAMAAFAPQDGTSLSLTGSTNVDPATLALLTALPNLQAA